MPTEISPEQAFKSAEPYIKCWDCEATNNLHHIKMQVTATKERIDVFLCDLHFEYFIRLFGDRRFSDRTSLIKD